MKKMNICIKIAILGFLTVITACSQKDAVLLKINDSKYTVADFKERIMFSPTDDSLKRANRFNEFVDIMLVVEAGKERGYQNDSVVLRSLENHKKELIARNYYQNKIAKQVKISEIEIRRQHEKLIDQYHLGQIVVASESLARFIENQLDNGVAFDSLLRYSLDTITVNGDIGEFNALMLPDEVLNPLSKLNAGQTTKAVQFGDYFYVFKVIEHKTLETPTFDQVKDNIRSQLMSEKSAEKAEQLVSGILAKADIEYNEEGLAALLKPDSMITPEDMNKWVVKRNDTSYVYVSTIRDAVLFQYRRTGMDPKQLIERVLIPDLIYEQALREFYDKKPEVKRQLRNALATLVYQKVYNEEVLNKVTVDSLEVVLHYKNNKEKYAGKKLEDCFSTVNAEVRDQKIRLLREDLFKRMRDRYTYEVNEKAYRGLFKEAK